MTGISDDQVMAAFELWKNLEGEKARVADDLKELFAEQKAFGHDTKAMRAAFRLKVKLDEASPEDAEHEAKVDLYLAALNAPRASRAYARENVEEFDAETGEVFDARSPRKAAEAVSERTAINQPETATECAAPEKDAAADERNVEATVEQRSSATEFNPMEIARPPKTARDYRPHCLKPDACGASGLDHCYSCRRAMKAQEEFA